VEGTKEGGTVVVEFSFSIPAQFDELDLFFTDMCYVKWKCGEYTRSGFSLNLQANTVSKNCAHPNLPHKYSVMGTDGTTSE